MKNIISLVLFLTVFGLADHVIPPENYGPPYLYPADPAERPYQMPVAAGESTYISGGWCTDSHSGYRHADFAADFDTDVGQWAYCARAGKVLAIEEAPGGLPSYYTIQIGRVDSMPDSTSPRGNGWRHIQTLDMYRHMNGSTKVVNYGDWVEQGAPIAQVNNVAHVHFEVNVNGWSFVSPVDTTYPVSSIPIPFVGLTSRPQGFPELYDTYVSENTIIGIEKGLPRQAGQGAVSLSLFPNPFKPATAVRFSLAQAQTGVRLDVFDPSGRLVENLMAESFLNAGTHSLVWAPGRLASGLYVCRLKTDGAAVTRRVHKTK
jgi:murein DD-endopeptidase MepM/ murein hydrolase activator NlpD